VYRRQVYQQQRCNDLQREQKRLWCVVIMIALHHVPTPVIFIA
jgi:2-polyprenyl-3-methyl-5-hydroxy-6-metoxy-1,4-benzoquinol methylase